MDDLSDLSLRQKKFVTLSIMFVAIFFLIVGWYCGSMSTYEDAYWEGEAAGYHHGQFWAYDEAGYLKDVVIYNLTEEQAADIRFYKDGSERIEVFSAWSSNSVDWENGLYDFTYALILDPDYQGNITAYYALEDDYWDNIPDDNIEWAQIYREVPIYDPEVK